jgi:predicted SAM-dependent methyltransferase
MKLARRLASHVRMLQRRRPLSAGSNAGAVQPPPAALKELKTADFADLAYQVILNRPIDPGGYEAYVPLLESGRMSRYQFVLTLFNSLEFKAPQISETLHRSRLQLVKQLPRGDVIVDLGGSCAGRQEGALVVMGYPHRFKSLTIVEPPREERHAIYSDHCGEYRDIVRTRLGPVDYLFTSMADLSPIGSKTVDLVYSGESIEHITVAEAKATLREVRRVLKPGGLFCLDTPNRAVTKLQCPTQYINPDHKHEYTHPELSALLQDNGFVVRQAKGLCLAEQSVKQGTFIPEECIRNEGIFDNISSSYLLYYECERIA